MRKIIIKNNDKHFENLGSVDVEGKQDENPL